MPCICIVYLQLVTYFCNFFVFPGKFDLPQVKRNLMSSTMNSVNELPHRLPSGLKLRKFKNEKKISNWVEMQASVQSPHQKRIFGSSGQKLRKSRYQTVLVFSNFA